MKRKTQPAALRRVKLKVKARQHEQQPKSTPKHKFFEPNIRLLSEDNGEKHHFFD